MSSTAPKRARVPTPVRALARRRLAGRPLALVVVVGALGGLLGAGYLLALEALTSALGPDGRSPLRVGVTLTLVGVSLVAADRLLGPAGDVELLVDNIHVHGGARDLREARNVLPTSLLCVAAGGALGPEAPLVQTAGATGSLLGRRWRLEPGDVRILTIGGMAAAFAVLFGAPFGAAVFALELPHRRGLEHHEALLPAVVGSLTGLLTLTLTTGRPLAPIWTHVGDEVATGPLELAWSLAGAAGGALLAVTFVTLVRLLRRGTRRLPRAVRPVLAGVVLGLLGWWSPYALGFGEHQLDPALVELGAAGLAVAAVAKLLGCATTLAGGWRGGFIIPLFFVAATAGTAVGQLVGGPAATVLPAALMAATVVGATNTVLGSTLVVTEMAGLHLLPTTLLAAVVALLLTGRVGMIGTQRARAATPPLVRRPEPPDEA